MVRMVTGGDVRLGVRIGLERVKDRIRLIIKGVIEEELELSYASVDGSGGGYVMHRMVTGGNVTLEAEAEIELEV